MFIHAIIADEFHRELCISILFVYLQNYFEDLAFLVDVCTCKKKMNFHHLFAVLLFGHNLTSDIFFIQQRHCVKRLEQCLTFDPLHYAYLKFEWNLNWYLLHFN